MTCDVAATGTVAVTPWPSWVTRPMFAKGFESINIYFILNGLD